MKINLDAFRTSTCPGYSRMYGHVPDTAGHTDTPPYGAGRETKMTATEVITSFLFRSLWIL